MKKIALVLVIIGAINWGCVGLFELDLVGYLFGGTYSLISRSIFTLVGISGLYSLYTLSTLKDDVER
ncbi:DUF378 domain-containing protein [Paraclostridium ghonii]